MEEYRKILERIVEDFETDFVIDGKIVDNPEKRYSLLPVWYNLAKEALLPESASNSAQKKEQGNIRGWLTDLTAGDPRV